MHVTPEVTPIPCLKDNYAYLLRCPSTGLIGVVDPSAAQPLIKVLMSTYPLLRVPNPLRGL